MLREGNSVNVRIAYKIVYPKKAPSLVIPQHETVEEIRQRFDLDTVYKLASNENPLGVSPKAIEAIRNIADKGNLYPDSQSDKLLIAKIAQRHALSTENVFIACGAANVLKHACDVFIQPQDECIICSPTYPPYYYLVFKNEGVIIDLPVTEDQYLDLPAIEKAITKKTKLLFLCNPNNPTSTSISRNDIRDLLTKIPNNIIVLADEAYIDFVDNIDEVNLVPLLSEFPNLIIIRTFSKVYGLAAVRLGYALACPEIIKYLNKSVDARSLNIFAIEGGVAALDDKEFYLKTIENNRTEREYLTRELGSLGYKVYKSQANFLWVNFFESTIDIYKKLLRHGVIIRGEFNFGRISIGTHNQNSKLVKAFKEL